VHTYGKFKHINSNVSITVEYMLNYYVTLSFLCVWINVLYLYFAIVFKTFVWSLAIFCVFIYLYMAIGN